MSSRPAPRHRRMVALASGALLLTASGLAAVAVSPASAAPADGCGVAYPVSEVTEGQQVDGLTVVKGTTPTSFTGEVLGVLEDGIAPDLDMIMVDLDMPEFDRTGGVWQGMSGSPVYAADGRLLGAVAYGLSYGPSPIAGVTPYEEMDDHLADGLPTKVGVSRAEAATIAAAGGTTRAQAAQGFAELPVPTSIAGVSDALVQKSRAVAGTRTYLDTTARGVGRAAAAPAGPETLVAGGNLAVSASYGDVLIGGVGTATSVCGDRVVGFGHPAFYSGSTTLGLHPASAVYVQPDSLGSPFKVANIAGIAGTITDDRIAGVTGTVGALPATRTVTASASYEGRERTGSSEVVAPEPGALAETTFYQVISNLDRVFDGTVRGTAVQDWTIRGTNRGTAFTLASGDRYTGDDLLYEPAFTVADVVYALGDIDGVEIDDVDVDSDADDSLARYEVGAVQQLRKNRWVTVTRRAPLQARAGSTVRMRVQLTGTGGARTLTVPPVKIPRSARGGEAVLTVQGGADSYSGIYGESFAEIRKGVDGALRHDEVRVQLGSPSKVDFSEGGDDELFFRAAPGQGGKGKAGKGSSGKKNGGKKGNKGTKGGKGKGGKPTAFVSSTDLGPLDHVVGGSSFFVVEVR